MTQPSMEDIINQSDDLDLLKEHIHEMSRVLKIFMDNNDWAVTDYGDWYWCLHCEGENESPSEIKHKLGCPVITAKALLGK